MYSYASVRRPPVCRALPGGHLCDVGDDTLTPAGHPGYSPAQDAENPQAIAKGMLLCVIKG